MATLSTSAAATPYGRVAFVPHQEPSATEKLLVKYSKVSIELLNNREYDHQFFANHVSPRVYVDMQGKRTTGLDGYINNFKRDADRSPNFYVDVDMNGTALVDEDAGSGTVVLSQHLTGFGDEDNRGMAKAATILMSWRRARGKWVCGSVTMIFGTPEFLV